MLPGNPLSTIPSEDADFNQDNPLSAISSGDANFNQAGFLSGYIFPDNPLPAISSENTDFNRENNIIDDAGFLSGYTFPDNPLSTISSEGADFNQAGYGYMFPDNPLSTIPSGDANFNQDRFLSGYDGISMFSDNPLPIQSEYVDLNQDQKNYHNNNGNYNNNNNEENNITNGTGFLHGYDLMFPDNPLSTILPEYVDFNQDNNTQHMMDLRFDYGRRLGGVPLTSEEYDILIKLEND
ncbi:7485_t:CDS:2 [Entrophospora sp. SA101]|nr:4810_t:CDS:2 [Entrophospora sp. SA101]CAJ0757956.1 24546_t:CDS:2 [Entrophospora sp. SA101]CAJ0765719.1 7485_t:CDS:2 [Entrophospora sp. SA101]CAJ0824189.1 16925_t:CDS:2 [Entrophospora sp. SA101]CAJ0824214.1 19846_t:CDS:2 [Entrophospora sp. SA101]